MSAYNETSMLLDEMNGSIYAEKCQRKARWYSFGYDESTEDYKIVEITSTTTNKVYLYSLKTQKWKIIGKSPFKFSLNSDRIFLNGAFHWVTYEHPERIVALDLAKETYAKLLFPEYYSISQDDYRDFRLTSLGESLCLNCDSWGTHMNLDP
ncbi:F-box associated domain containing protein [Tanacetum coccineum]